MGESAGNTSHQSLCRPPYGIMSPWSPPPPTLPLTTTLPPRPRAHRGRRPSLGHHHLRRPDRHPAQRRLRRRHPRPHPQAPPRPQRVPHPRPSPTSSPASSASTTTPSRSSVHLISPCVLAQQRQAPLRRAHPHPDARHGSRRPQRRRDDLFRLMRACSRNRVPFSKVDPRFSVISSRGKLWIFGESVTMSLSTAKAVAGAPARWHSGGEPIVYLASATGTALIEVLVHLQVTEDKTPRGYTLLQVIAPEDLEIPLLHTPLDDSWRDNLTLTRHLGDGWLASRQSALARVPSAIIPLTFNYLLNPPPPRRPPHQDRHLRAGDLRSPPPAQLDFCFQLQFKLSGAIKG